MAQGQTMGGGQVERVGVGEARREVEAGRALLVCAYDDERCARMPLQGAITRRALEQRAPSLLRDHVIIFYCA
jgi:hypothetical protein